MNTISRTLVNFFDRRRSASTRNSDRRRLAKRLCTVRIEGWRVL